ncbi:MAG: VanZ family protein [Lactobacillus sp.]|nr:VanZ family protein [Lactobacillus sp.]
MIFLGPLFQIVQTHYQARINHFPLIELIFYSLDKTILYLLIIMGLRWLWHLLRHKPMQWRREVKVMIFTVYILMLLSLTVFRGIYFPWQIQWHFQRPLSQINLTPLVQTLKLTQGRSPLDFFYNSLGNIFWFLPFGIGAPILSAKHRSFWTITFAGIVLSVSIEIMQFLLYTGVSDIDDVIFNTLGTMIGYALYALGHHWLKAK